MRPTLSGWPRQAQLGDGLVKMWRSSYLTLPSGETTCE
jgi:hypothetical protein